MTLRQIVAALNAQGVSVSYRNRADGSIVITKIGKKSYSHKMGNAEARKMIGVSLSPDRAAQLQSIRTPKKRFGNPKSPKLDPITNKMLKEAQKAFKKRNKEEWKANRGMVTRKNVRYNIKHFGVEETRKRLEHAAYYAKGFAYEENVDAFMNRLTNIIWSDSFAMLSKNDQAKIKRMLAFFEDRRGKRPFTEKELSARIDKLYKILQEAGAELPAEY